MGKTNKRRKAKEKLPVEEAVEKIVAMMKDSAKSLPEPQRAVMLGKIHVIAAETIAESHAEASKRKQASAGGASSRMPVRRKKP